MDLSNLDSFRKPISEARISLHRLYSLKKQADDQINDLKDLIRANANFLPEEERECELLSLEVMKTPETIAEAVKLSLFIARGRNNSLTPVQIRELAQERGFDFSGYTNPMASIHSILKRMREADPPEVEFDEPSGTYMLVPYGLPTELGEEAINHLNHMAWERVMNEESETADKVAARVIQEFLSAATEKRRRKEK